MQTAIDCLNDTECVISKINADETIARIDKGEII